MKRVLCALSIFVACVPCIFAQRIVVTSPWAGLTWNQNSTYNIQWTSEGVAAGATVDVYLFQGGHWARDIARGIANTGSLPWTVAADAPVGASQIQVALVDGTVSGLSDTFTIGRAGLSFTPRSSSTLPPLQAKPRIQITAPNGGQVYHAGDPMIISWATYNLPVQNVRIDIIKHVEGSGDPAFWRAGDHATITVVQSDVKLATWTVSDTLREGTYKIYISTLVEPYIRDASDGTIRIDPPR